MGREQLAKKIRDLTEKKEAVILAHNYQLGEVQDVADYVGDSLELSRIAAGTEAEVIVFCGVRFMAETAHILSPEKTVLLPEEHALCWMAAMIDGEGLRKMKARHPDASVVCYVNSTAEIKAESDICCTSANAVAVVNAAEAEQVIFVPDQNLGAWTGEQTDKEVLLWPGHCLAHVRILPQDIERRRREHPDAVVLAHPECVPAVSRMANEVLSTGGMVRFVQSSDQTCFIIATELGIIHRLEKENPGKTFIPASEAAICPNMKITSLESVLLALEDSVTRITIAPELRKRAARAVERMISIG